jgi:hypothetical protein
VALLDLPDRTPPAALEPSAGGPDDQPLVEPGPLVTAGSSGTEPGGRHDATEHDDADVAPASVALTGRFDWGAIAFGGVVIALGGLALGRRGLAAIAARRAALRPSVASDEAVQPRPSQPRWPGIGAAW